MRAAGILVCSGTGRVHFDEAPDSVRLDDGGCAGTGGRAAGSAADRGLGVDEPAEKSEGGVFLVAAELHDGAGRRRVWWLRRRRLWRLRQAGRRLGGDVVAGLSQG